MKKGLPKDYHLRILEIIPGLVSWSLIFFPFWGSLVFPFAVAYYVLAFYVYWLYRSFSTAILSIIAHFRMQASQTYDWMGDVVLFPQWKMVRHVILIPSYKEPLYILRRTLKGVVKQSYPTKYISVVLSLEEREGKPAKIKADTLLKEFKNSFEHFFITYHPDLPGEVKGKSSNTAWGARLAKQKLIDGQKADIGYTTITSNDADAVLDRQYFSYLTFKFLDDPPRYR